MAQTAPTHVDIYTDGACSGNPGPGGWGVILRFGKHEKELSGFELQTTNNRMELTAAIRGLEALKRTMDVHVHTDSTYVRDGMTQWMPNWVRRNWQTHDKKPVKNKDLWEELYTLSQRYSVKWHWVKGHSGHPENDRVDALARAEVDRYLGR